ncbi:hypothetical protein [Vogesella sp. LIG4]|uniref:hypothetical protein n=1 Tax=Vogesella sp. LIG4 TaxID=1192162 RepID=UPI00081FCDE2|nr:hypothetical protein [Vogesella sp. LIG4]SCK29937.1 hypothetical protein PSELUDRAFT_3705 [Vogesella sp. LIG4]
MPRLAVSHSLTRCGAVFFPGLNLSRLLLPALPVRHLQAPAMAQAGADKVQLPLYPWNRRDGALLAGLLMAVVMKVVA